MENIPFKSIDEVDDISTLDEYKVALDAGLTPEAALKAVARRSRSSCFLKSFREEIPDISG